MEKRVFIMILVVIVGVLAGVSIVTKQAREPLLRNIIQRQGIMLQNQNRMERDLNSVQNFGGAGAVAGGGNQAADLKALEDRIASLESRLQGVHLAGGGQQAKGSAGAPPAPPPDANKIFDIAVAHTPVQGKKNAPVTIVEFGDLQCPFCARFHPPVKEVLAAYPKKVKYMLKNFPLGFHGEAKPAAKAAFAAGEQGKYFEMVDALLENGRSLSSAKYDELAEKLGLNMKKFKEDIEKKDAKWEDYIQKDMALASKVGVRGTPTFFINGKKTNARDLAGWKVEIDQILKSK